MSRVKVYLSGRQRLVGDDRLLRARRHVLHGPRAAPAARRRLVGHDLIRETERRLLLQVVDLQPAEPARLARIGGRRAADVERDRVLDPVAVRALDEDVIRPDLHRRQHELLDVRRGGDDCHKGEEPAMAEWYSPCARPRQPDSVIPEGVDQLVLAHRRAAFDTDVGGPLLELVLRPVFVVLGVAALLWPVSLRLPALAMRAAFSLLAPSRRRASYCSSSLIDDHGSSPWPVLSSLTPPCRRRSEPKTGSAKRRPRHRREGRPCGDPPDESPRDALHGASYPPVATRRKRRAAPVRGY